MSKSSKIFIIISGLYLFTLTFLLLTQPRSGYTATLGQVLFYYALYLPLWAMTAVTIFIAKKNANKNWVELAFGERTLFWTIILFVIVGFALNFDYQRQSGCFVEDETMYSPTKFILSISSILLLSCGYYYSNTKLGTTLLIIEFIIWTFKALFFSSSLDLFFPGYFTLTCWALRFALIFKVLNRNSTDAITSNKKTTR